MKIITGSTGQNHITANDDGALHASIFGEGCYVLAASGRFTCTVVDNTTVQIGPGEGLMYGRHFRTPKGSVDTLTIQAGVTGYNRCDIIAAHYKNTGGVESIGLAVLSGSSTTGTAADPGYTQDDVSGGATESYMPLYRVRLSGISIDGVDTLYTLRNFLAQEGHKHDISDVISGALPVKNGGTGAASAAAARENLGTAAKSHTHGLIASDGKLTGQTNKVMVVDSGGAITAYGGTAVRSMIGAEAANTCLPLAGGNMTGAINFGGATRGVVWTTANGTVWSFRPYYSGNIFQLTLAPTGKAEYGALNVDANGNADFSSEITAKGYIKGKRFRAEADNDYPTYEFKANSQTNYGGMMQMGSTNMFGFYEYPKELDGQSTRYYEGYLLPEPSTGLTANKSYKILTTKVAVSIAQGGTGATTAAQALTNLGAVPLAGGVTISGNMTFAANLWVSNDSSAGGYVKIWEDNEGGNIAIGSKSGKVFEMDAYNDTNFRIFSQQSGSVKGMILNGTNGNLSIDGDFYRGGNRVADVQHGSLEVGTSGKTITFPHAFAGVPSVTATGSKFCHLYVKDITKTGCTLVSGEGNNTVNWIAAY